MKSVAVDWQNRMFSPGTPSFFKTLILVLLLGNSFFSLPKCKVVFVRWYLTCKVVPYKKILVENERPYKKPCKVVPYKKIIQIDYLKMSAYIKSHVRLHLTCNVVPYKK